MTVIHSVDTEKALLGCILVDDGQFDAVLEYISTPGAFHNELHRQIFQVMLNMRQQKQTIDIVTVADRLPDHAAYIAEMTNAVASTANVANYAAQLRDKFHRREIYRACQQGVNAAISMEHESAEQVAAAVDSLLLKATAGITTNRMMTALELSMLRIKKYMDDLEQGRHFYGIQTGYHDVDALIDGFGFGESIIIAARPSMGKTALALNIVLNAAKDGHPVDFFSLEMSKDRVMDRLLCMEGRVNAKRMRLRKLNTEETRRLEQASGVIAELPIRIYDGSMNTAQIRSALARRATPGESMAVVDFLTLVSDLPTLSAHERYGTIAKQLQSMATEFYIPVVVLAQLNRKVEERKEKKPINSDLRESGNIEEAADKVIFIYRDDYYNPESKDKGVAEIICAKNRDGETGYERLTWRPEVLRFEDMYKGGSMP